MAPAPEPLAISSSKKKLAGFGVGSAACAAFGIKWWMVADAALVGTGVAVIGIGFFALGGLYPGSSSTVTGSSTTPPASPPVGCAGRRSPTSGSG